MEKYIQIKKLSEVAENETICAFYPHPVKNVLGKRNEERMIKAEKDAKEGKCKLYVWRSVAERSPQYGQARIQEEIEMRKCNWNDRGIQKFGYFHQFGLNCASDAEGCGVQWTEAIVEDKYGNINNVPPSSIQFVPNDFINKDYEEHKENFGF